MDNTRIVRAVISTLNTVEVKGKENLDKMLGCINALEQVAKNVECAAAAAAENETEEDPNG